MRVGEMLRTKYYTLPERPPTQQSARPLASVETIIRPVFQTKVSVFKQTSRVSVIEVNFYHQHLPVGKAIIFIKTS
jgi:hypothetical protein